MGDTDLPEVPICPFTYAAPSVVSVTGNEAVIQILIINTNRGINLSAAWMINVEATMGFCALVGAEPAIIAVIAILDVDEIPRQWTPRFHLARTDRKSRGGWG